MRTSCPLVLLFAFFFVEVDGVLAEAIKKLLNDMESRLVTH